jgi:hypothetical protein
MVERQSESIDFNGLDTHVHGPIRLGILTALQVDGALDFTTLKKAFGRGRWQPESASGKTRGKRLHHQPKGFRGAQTQNHLSNCGRRGAKALSEYVQSMKTLIGY